MVTEMKDRSRIQEDREKFLVREYLKFRNIEFHSLESLSEDSHLSLEARAWVRQLDDKGYAPI